MNAFLENSWTFFAYDTVAFCMTAICMAIHLHTSKVFPRHASIVVVAFIASGLGCMVAGIQAGAGAAWPWMDARYIVRIVWALAVTVALVECGLYLVDAYKRGTR